MSKILISGCGFSFSKQHSKTWVNIFKSCGLQITDISGPAVSNQYILNKTILELLENPNYDHILIQLTALGKLDVSVDNLRYNELVKNDSLRNFTFNNIWPSSISNEHISKQLYNKWLVSPELEVEDVFVKLSLLNRLYKNITVIQAYDINWVDKHKTVENLFFNFNQPLESEYKTGEYYKFHNHDNFNTVPCIQYQSYLAVKLSEFLKLSDNTMSKIKNIQRKLN